MGSFAHAAGTPPIQAAAPVLEHGSRVNVDQKLLLVGRIGPPQAPVGGIDAEPNPKRRVHDLIERALGSAVALTEWQIARQHGGIQLP